MTSGSMIDLGMTRETFLDHHYEKNFLLRRGAVQGAPISWKDIDTALFSWDPRDGLLRLFENGPIPLEHFTEIFHDVGMARCRIVKDIFYEKLRGGATLVLNRIDTKCEAAHHIVMELARFVGDRAVANGYVAFGGDGTFGKHWDTHDVFAVQLIGRKRWRLYEPTFELPLPNQTSKEHKADCPAAPVFDEVLEAGDVLYLPRGWWHEALPIEGAETLHIAVGLHPMRAIDLVAWSCGNGLGDQLQMRQSLRMDGEGSPQAREYLQSLIETLASPSQLIAFKQAIAAQERVVTPFSIGTLGTPSADCRIFRPNSAYRQSVTGRPVVNGRQLSIDDDSAPHVKRLIQHGLSENTDSQSLARKDSAMYRLSVQLAQQDVLTPLYSVANRHSTQINHES